MEGRRWEEVPALRVEEMAASSVVGLWREAVGAGEEAEVADGGTDGEGGGREIVRGGRQVGLLF